MKYVWVDLPDKKNCFTVRNATMVNLNTGKIIRHFSANTKIVVVQKCVTPTCTYYRTADAAHHYLNYAFEASAFGLPNEKAPSEPSVYLSTNSLSNDKPETRTPNKPAEKQKSVQKVVLPEGGEGRRRPNIFKRLFGRKHGKTKNS